MNEKLLEKRVCELKKKVLTLESKVSGLVGELEHLKNKPVKKTNH